MSRALAVTCLLCLLSVQGCRPGMRSRLVGRWEGQADTVAQYTARNSTSLQIANESPAAPAAGEEGGPTSDQAGGTIPAGNEGSLLPERVRTDLENYDFRIGLELRSDGTVEMWRDEGADRLRGTWEVQSSAGRKATLLIAAQPADVEGASVHRRFEIELDTDHQGFTLTEVGADTRFGWVHFRRLEE